MSTLNNPTPPLDKWQTTFFFNIRANFKTNPSESDVIVSLPLGKTLPSDEELRAVTATATADLTETLRSAIDAAVAGNNTSGSPFLEGDDWKTVWGPQVFCVGPQAIIVPESHDDDYIAKFTSTNAMYVVHSAKQKRYIVAIAATNTPSIFDWIVEDADTARVVAWEKALRVWNDGISAGAATAAVAAAAATTANTAPYISHATFAGITILLNLVDSVITRKTLVDFLKGLTPPADTTVTFTGHSLAGALSPTLAMACFAPGAGLLKGSAWRIGDAMVYPTAGATPGNGPFASLFNGAGWGGADDKGTQPWQVWNHNLYNNLDIVPHAWGEEMLKLIPGLYYVEYKKSKEVGEISGLHLAGRAIAKTGEDVAGAYTPINNRALNPIGKDSAKNEFFDLYEVDKMDRPLTLPQYDEMKPRPTNKRTIPWDTQMALQHTVAYGDLLGIPKKLMGKI